MSNLQPNLELLMPTNWEEQGKNRKDLRIGRLRYQTNKQKLLWTIIFENNCGFPCSNCQFLTFVLCKCVLLYIYTVVFPCVSTRLPNNCKSKCVHKPLLQYYTIIYPFRPKATCQYLNNVFLVSSAISLTSACASQLCVRITSMRALPIAPTISFHSELMNQWWPQKW